MEQLARQLQKLREDRQLSLRVLAELSGVSASAISQIESSQVSPSIATLEKLCLALGVHIGTLFDEPEEGPMPILLRSGQRRRIYSAGSHASIEPLARDYARKKMQPILLTLEAGGECGEHPYSSAEGEEFAMVIEGTAKFEQQEHSYELGKGDAIYYDPRQLHNWRNNGTEAAVLLIIVAQ
ncbi:cupin domain-containing protein [Acidithiobacillus sp. CV18-2]|nr:cupin domain-containing protein [Acidithiobacillus sp. CV18-3]MBU2756129.1 cupin domain-containing protein [Acidithiobacillus sp. BN09-2]MBU2777866.1 cupin domain-containing protein [Acidithiobacillus sp. CV18-2]MBU2798061.1 cupin domain-containing protein [Acidithiobacillus sp. VAN18-4]UTV82094.1 XRE family transcriptional regulator [Acidithiobacillus sp. YTS05]